MSPPEKTTVLIVGAGPSGLAAACSLLHHGVRDLIIVDAAPEGQNSSRALVVHAATLEALDTIGCGDDLVAQGAKATVYIVGTRSTKLISPDMESLKPHTRHPYMLVIPQNLTERALEKKLTSSGVVLYRGLKVVGLRCNTSDSRLTDVMFEDGRVISAMYVIGADGARSVVRAAAGIGFSDPTVVEEVTHDKPAQMFIADVTFDNIETDSPPLEVTLTPQNFFVCFPLPFTYNKSLATEGEAPIPQRLFRIGCTVPWEDGEIPESPSIDYLQNLVDRFGPFRLSSDPSVNPKSKPTRVKEFFCLSRFHDCASIAETAFTRLGPRGSTDGSGGAVLLIGDAAHIHSPAGGQGMNLGIRDGVFLGEALSKHIHAARSNSSLDEADAILSEFATLRRARALGVIKLAKGYPFVIRYGPWMSWLCPIEPMTVRDWALWVSGSIPFSRRKMAWELSGLGRR